jgi:hypothetical protein
MVHRRGEEKYAEHLTKREQRILVNNILLDFSLEDHVNGEITFESQTEQTVRDKVKEAFGFIPQWAINREHGEVLNRYSIKIHPLTVKFGRGVFQK